MEKKIFEALHKMCDGKPNQEDIAKRLGISRPYLNRLLNKKRPIDGITLRMLRALFPRISVNLEGDIADNSGTNNGVVGNHVTINGTVNGAVSSPASVEDFRNKAIQLMIDLEIPPDALQKVLKALKDLQI